MSQPVVVDGAVCRVIRTNGVHVEVQEWHDMYWQPSTQPLWRVETGTAAPTELLVTLGVQEGPWPRRDTREWVPPTLRQLAPAEAAALLLTCCES